MRFHLGDKVVVCRPGNKIDGFSGTIVKMSSGGTFAKIDSLFGDESHLSNVDWLKRIDYIEDDFCPQDLGILFG